MAALGSTHVGRLGPARPRRHKASGPAPVVMQRVQSVGRLAHRHFDPVTGRRKNIVHDRRAA